SSRYSPPYSACGHQFVWITTVLGQVPASDSFPAAGRLAGWPPCSFASAAQPATASPSSASTTPAVLSRFIRAPLLLRRRQPQEPARRSLPVADGGMQAPGPPPGQRAEGDEHRHTEQGRQDNRAEQLLGLQPLAVQVDEDADPRIALLEEEVADD